jgi:hypothetical protein
MGQEGKMNFAVPDSVIKESSQCPNTFSCLQTGHCGSPEKCEVQSTGGKNKLSLFSKESMRCPYRFLAGNGIVCHCPTHYWIYQNGNGQQPNAANFIDASQSSNPQCNPAQVPSQGFHQAVLTSLANIDAHPSSASPTTAPLGN